jgi:hypothetical protein
MVDATRMMLMNTYLARTNRHRFSALQAAGVLLLASALALCMAGAFMQDSAQASVRPNSQHSAQAPQAQHFEHTAFGALRIPGESSPTVAILCVATFGGVQGAPCANPTPYPNVQAAIDAANDGDEIRIANGTYTGSGSAVASSNKSLTISGGYVGAPGGWTTMGSVTNTFLNGQNARASFEVQGSVAITLQNLYAQNGPLLNNSGTINVSTRTLFIQSSASSTVNGAYNVSSGAALEFFSSVSTVSAGTTVSGPGTVRISQFSNVTFAGSFTAQNIELTAGTIAGTAAITATSVLTWSGGTMSGTGSTYIPAGARLAIDGANPKFLDIRTFNNAGSAIVSGPASQIYFSNGATFNNTGSFELRNDSTLNFNGGTGLAFNNSGVFTKTASSGTTSVGVAFNNTGTVSLLTGMLQLNSGGTGTGSFILSPGTTLNHTGTSSGAFSVPGGAVLGVPSGASTLAAGATFTGTGLIRINGGTLTLNASITASNVDFSSGTLTGSQGLTVTGALTWTSGTMSGTGTTYVSASAVASLTGGNGRTLDGRTINNAGSVIWADTGAISINNAVTIKNTGTFDIRGDSSMCCSSLASFINNGLVLKSGGSGTTNILAMSFINNRDVTVLAGILSLKAGASSAGFNVAANAILDLGGSYTLNTGASVTGAGLARVSGGTLNIVGNPRVRNLELTSFGPPSTIAGPGNLTVLDAMNWTGGTMSGAGLTSIEAGGVLSMTAPTSLFMYDRTLNVAGTTVFGSGGLFLNNGAVFNNIGTFDNRADGLFGTNAGVLGTFNNKGLFIKSGGTVGAGTTCGVIFNNFGTVSVLTGTLHMNGGGVSSGTFNVPATSALRFGFGTHTLDSNSSLSGSGTIEFAAGAVNVAGAFDTTGTTVISGGQANFNASATSARTTLSSGVLSGAGVLTTTGVFTWSGGAMAGSGVTVIPVGAFLNIAGSSTISLVTRTLLNAGTATLSLNNSFGISAGGVISNTGLFDVQNSQSIDNGAFYNAGTFRKSAGGFSPIGAAFTNVGTVSILTGTVHFSGSYTQDAGVTSLAGGTLNSGPGLNFRGGTLQQASSPSTAATPNRPRVRSTSKSPDSSPAQTTTACG